jgi:predicted DNA-binding protein
MIDAIREHIGDLEELCLAEIELEHIKSGRSKLLFLEDVMKTYGLEN